MKIYMESSIGGFITSFQKKASEEDFSRMILNWNLTMNFHLETSLGAFTGRLQ